MLADPHSGIARATGDLAAGLAGAGHEVHALADGSAARAGAAPGVTVHHIAGTGLLDRAAAVRDTLAGLHAMRPIDIALAPLWGCEGVLAQRDGRYPLVVSCMTSSTTLAAIDGSATGPEGREAILLERATLRDARHLHGLTRAAVERTLAEYPGAPLTVGVVGRGLRDRTPAGHPAQRSANPDRVEILFIGRLEPRKGIDVLLDAVCALVDEGLDVGLTVVGPGDSQDSHGARFRARATPATTARVRFAGPVRAAELDRLLAGADVVCQPSRYESHGVVLLEAMMFGKAIVTTSAGGIPEVVEDGGNALLARPGDTASLVRELRAAVSSDELRRRLGARSRERYLERFGLDAVTRGMVELFESAVAAHHAAARATRRPAARDPRGSRGG